MSYTEYRRAVLAKVKITLYPANTDDIIKYCWITDRSTATAAQKIANEQAKLYGL